MSRRRVRRRAEKAQRHPLPPDPAPSAAPGPRSGNRVERLTYTRAEAAQALGLSRSTFDRRVLPHIETIELPWGAKLVPVDELKRLLSEWRHPAKPRPKARKQGRRAAVLPEVVERIRREHAAGTSLGGIARRLTDDQVPTAQGGRRWWPSTVRAILARTNLPQ